MLSGREVSVIGAGVAGLAAGAALAQHGAKVQIFERANALEHVGAGLQISPNGAVVLAALGIDLGSLGLASQAVELVDYAAGLRVLKLDLSRNRYATRFILTHRADLIDALSNCAIDAGASLHLGVAMSVTEAPGDLVLGADGISSGCRAVLNGNAQASFSGQVAWRTMIRDEAAPIAQVFMGPGRHMVTYPLKGGWRNIVAVEARASWAEEGWNLPDDSDNLCHAFREFAPHVRNWLKSATDVKLWGLFRHPLAPNWTHGNVALLGDAAHPTLPFLAQGANLALEDAWCLTSLLSRLPQQQALARYQNSRKPRVTRAINVANANARNYHLTNPFIRFAAHSALRLGGTLAPNAVLGRFDWLYGHDVTEA